MPCEHKLIWSEDVRFLYCEKCKEINIEETRAEREKGRYIDRCYDTVTCVGYKRIHHVNEVYKRLLCIEPNPPTSSDINELKLKLEDDYSLRNIYSKLTTKERKHLTYLYCELNDIPPPDIAEFVRTKFYNIIGMMKAKKLPHYLYIFNYVCEKLDCKELQEYIFIRRNNSKWNQILDKAWMELEAYILKCEHDLTPLNNDKSFSYCTKCKRIFSVLI